MNILLLEDDETLGTILTAQLESAGFQTTWCKSLEAAEREIRTQQFALALFDVMLPDGSALELVKGLKTLLPCPLLFISATNSADQRLLGYELGAVEFIPKPFFFKELLLLIHRALGEKKTIQTGLPAGFSIDRKAMSVTFADGTTRFPAAKDFLVLMMLVDASPAVVSREDILQKLSKRDVPPTPRVIDNAVLRLRQLLEEGGIFSIRSVRGIGYQWTPLETRD